MCGGRGGFTLTLTSIEVQDPMSPYISTYSTLLLVPSTREGLSGCLYMVHFDPEGLGMPISGQIEELNRQKADTQIDIAT